MQELKNRLKEMYDPRFRNVPGVFKVEYSDGPEGDFFVTFHYRAKDKTMQIFRQHFDRNHCFGDTCKRPSENDWSYRMKVCRFGQDTIGALMADMGL